MQCPQCQADNAPGASFCARCGTSLSGAPTGQAPPASSSAWPPPPPPPTQGYGQSPGWDQPQGYPPPGPYGFGTGPGVEKASFGIRFGAALIDGILLFVVNFVLASVLGTAGRGLSLVVSLGYYAYFEGSSGQTVGKKICNIRVVDTTTLGPIGYGRAAIRWVVRIVSGCALLLGYLWMLWDPEKQTWHDKAATSYVVPTTVAPVSTWP